jgi:hypothetical protein
MSREIVTAKKYRIRNVIDIGEFVPANRMLACLQSYAAQLLFVHEHTFLCAILHFLVRYKGSDKTTFWWKDTGQEATGDASAVFAALGWSLKFCTAEEQDTVLGENGAEKFREDPTGLDEILWTIGLKFATPRTRHLQPKTAKEQRLIFPPPTYAQVSLQLAQLITEYGLQVSEQDGLRLYRARAKVGVNPRVYVETGIHLGVKPAQELEHVVAWLNHNESQLETSTGLRERLRVTHGVKVIRKPIHGQEPFPAFGEFSMLCPGQSKHHCEPQRLGPLTEHAALYEALTIMEARRKDGYTNGFKPGLPETMIEGAITQDPYIGFDPFAGQQQNEQVLLHHMRLIAHAVAPGFNDETEGGYHEAAYELAVEALNMACAGNP